MYNVNVEGVLFGCQAASAAMSGENSTGTILNVESISSELATANQILYNTTKGAVRMITRSVAFELAGEGVRVNGIASGQIATEIVDGRMTDLHKEVATTSTSNRFQ